VEWKDTKLDYTRRLKTLTG